MSETKTTVPAEALKNIGGGECTAADWLSMVNDLTNAYESLIDFTSYVIGRVTGDPPAQP
jgi:hypothetical protein